ncbi:MAG: methyltransferase domain-containing protein [Nitrospinota bacterium]|nr:MAG: methyltransferase domain-containing protein [Nitrospinota bacterium]
MAAHRAVTPTDDRAYWEAKYCSQERIFKPKPVPFLRKHVKLLPRGRALDLAMGEGRNAIFLAQHGFVVDGCDIAEVAVRRCLARAQELGVRVRGFVVDLTTYTIPASVYDVILCFYYLERSLIPHVKRGLRPGGMIVYETFTIEQMKYWQPRNPAYLLQPNELLHLFQDFHILIYRELDYTGKKAIASLIAQKPTEDG